MFDKNVQIIVIIVVVIILIWWFSSGNEKFANNVILPENPLVPQFTGPTHYDPTTSTIMTSPNFIPQHIESAWKHVEPSWSNKPSADNQKVEFEKVGAFDSATDLGKDTMAFNKCSKSCCSKQYPLPFNLTVDKEVDANIKDFVPSRFTCNNYWEDAGCLCITKNQSDNLAQRGGNVL